MASEMGAISGNPLLIVSVIAGYIFGSVSSAPMTEADQGKLEIGD